jgi:hypothetical protein
MIARAGRIYIQALMVAEVILLLASIAIHLSVLAGTEAVYEKYQGALGTAVIVLCGPPFAFKKKGAGLIAQIKSCPQWMWKSAVAIAAYGILTLLTLVISPTNSLFTSSLVGSGFPLGFEAVPICILYSTLWRLHLDGSGLIKNAGISLLFIGFGIVWATTTHQQMAAR